MSAWQRDTVHAGVVYTFLGKVRTSESTLRTIRSTGCRPCRIQVRSLFIKPNASDMNDPTFRPIFVSCLCFSKVLAKRVCLSQGRSWMQKWPKRKSRRYSWRRRCDLLTCEMRRPVVLWHELNAIVRVRKYSEYR